MKMKNKNSIKQIALQRILNQKIRQSGIKFFFRSRIIRGMEYNVYVLSYIYSESVFFFSFDANTDEELFRKMSPIFFY